MLWENFKNYENLNEIEKYCEKLRNVGKSLLDIGTDVGLDVGSDVGSNAGLDVRLNVESEVRFNVGSKGKTTRHKI